MRRKQVTKLATNIEVELGLYLKKLTIGIKEGLKKGVLNNFRKQVIGGKVTIDYTQFHVYYMDLIKILHKSFEYRLEPNLDTPNKCLVPVFQELLNRSSLPYESSFGDYLHFRLGILEEMNCNQIHLKVPKNEKL